MAFPEKPLCKQYIPKPIYRIFHQLDHLKAVQIIPVLGTGQLQFRRKSLAMPQLPFLILFGHVQLIRSLDPLGQQYRVILLGGYLRVLDLGMREVVCAYLIKRIKSTENQQVLCIRR
jgi:hypothetical protein